ncbi:MAG: hypothetical protein KDI82_06155 [Gammaproteobacteria bacterium]|nr:hypothetical protein [Gammaproteobacteria bacterium]
MLESALERDLKARPFEKTIRQFGEILKDDRTLLDKLDQTPDKDSFIDLYVALGAEQGCEFSRDDLLIVVQEQKQGSNWVIPKPVLRLIAERF